MFKSISEVKNSSFIKIDETELHPAENLLPKLQKFDSDIRVYFDIWKTTQSYKTGILTEYMSIPIIDNDFIMIEIIKINTVFIPKETLLYWSNINVKKSIPALLTKGKINNIVIIKMS